MNLPQMASEYLACRLGLSARHRADVLHLAHRIHRELGLVNGTMPTEKQLVGWLQSLLDRGRSPHSINHYVRVLNAVLRWGAAHGLCPSIRLPKIKTPPTVPEAWTQEEFNRLLAAASTMPGMVGRWPAKDWWPALLLTLYWTGARLSSVLRARPTDLDLQTGALRLMQTKNGRPLVCRLHAQAIEAIRRVYDPQADRLFVWPKHMSKFWAAHRQIVLAAGLPYRPYKTGTYRIKRTCLSYCWAADPAIAQRQADHSSAEITRRHYVDPRLVQIEARQAADVLPVPDWQPGPRQRMLFE